MDDRHKIAKRVFFMPVAMEPDFDPLWFSILICVNLQTSSFGYALFYFKGVAPEGCSMMHITRGSSPSSCSRSSAW